MAKRLDFLRKVVQPALFWSAGIWTLRADQYAQLRGVQRKMIRRMCNFRKWPEEDLDQFMRRTERTISDALYRHDIVSWDVQARREKFRWAGWVARLQIFDSARVTLHILLHQDLGWIRTIAAQNAGRQCHGRYLKPWRWETLLDTFFNENHCGSRWQDYAKGVSAWHELTSKIL